MGLTIRPWEGWFQRENWAPPPTSPAAEEPQVHCASSRLQLSSEHCTEFPTVGGEKESLCDNWVILNLDFAPLLFEYQFERSCYCPTQKLLHPHLSPLPTWMCGLPYLQSHGCSGVSQLWLSFVRRRNLTNSYYLIKSQVTGEHFFFCLYRLHSYTYICLSYPSNASDKCSSQNLDFTHSRNLSFHFSFPIDCYE